MHQKRHDARRKHIVLHVGIPSRPQTLEDVEMNVVFRDVVELTPVGILWSEEKGRREIPREQSAELIS